MALSSSKGEFGVPVYNLTDEEFTDHPFFDDLLMHRKKILYSVQPRQVVLVARENFRSYFDGGTQFGWRVLSDGENSYLSQFDMHVVSYDGRYYYIRKEGNAPVMHCGNHTQC